MEYFIKGLKITLIIWGPMLILVGALWISTELYSHKHRSGHHHNRLLWLYRNKLVHLLKHK